MAKKKSPSSVCVNKGNVLQSLFKWDNTHADMAKYKEHMAYNELILVFNRYLKILRSDRYG